MTEAMQRVKAHDVQAFSATAKKMVKKKDFSDQANAQLKLYNTTMKVNRLEMLKSQIGATLVDAGVSVESEMKSHLSKSYVDEVTRQAGILGQDRDDDLVKRASSVVNASFQGAQWSSRLWLGMAELQTQLGVQLSQAMIFGLNPRTIAKNFMPLINDTVRNKRAAAERLAITEMARVQDDAQMSSFRKYGIKYVLWIAEPGACKVCQDIASYNNGIYPIDDVPYIPEHPYCRCAKAAYVKKGSIKPLKKSVDSEPYADPSYQEHKIKTPAPIPKTLANVGKFNLDKAIDKRLGDIDVFSAMSLGNGTNETVKKTLNATSKKIASIVNQPSTQVRMRVKGGDRLESILKSHFKNQMETGTSEGKLNTTLRTKTTQTLFNLSDTEIAKLTPNEFEKYGYLWNRNKIEKKGRVSHYGAIIVQFKDDVKSRSTWMLGDSLKGNADNALWKPGKIGEESPSVMEQVIDGRVKGTDNSKRHSAIENKDWELDKSIKDISDLQSFTVPYVEAQIHGKLVATDIDKVLIPKDQVTQSLSNLLKKMKIPFEEI